MQLDFNTIFLFVFVLALIGLGVANLVESKNNQNKQLGRNYFGLLYITMGAGLILYKMMRQ
jgi:hypothetical protein